MIFYFTGTGNSLFAARTLAHDGEDVISMVDAVRSRAFRYTLKENEPLGFVFPVYFYTVSDPVLELVRNLTVENASFVYAVIPCGASIGAAGGFLKSELKKRGLELQRVDALVVPDGALIFYNIDPPEKMEKKLEAATKELASIKRGARATTSREVPRWGKRGLPRTTPSWARNRFMRMIPASTAGNARPSARSGRSPWSTAALSGRKANASSAAAALTAARSPRSSTAGGRPPAGGM